MIIPSGTKGLLTGPPSSMSWPLLIVQYFTSKFTWVHFTPKALKPYMNPCLGQNVTGCDQFTNGVWAKCLSMTWLVAIQNTFTPLGPEFSQREVWSPGNLWEHHTQSSDNWVPVALENRIPTTQCFVGLVHPAPSCQCWLPWQEPGLGRGGKGWSWLPWAPAVGWASFCWNHRPFAVAEVAHSRLFRRPLFLDAFSQDLCPCSGPL